MNRQGRLAESGSRARALSDVPTGPVRTCVGCRVRDQRSALVRVVLDPAAGRAQLVVDVRACLPGRGAWIHPEAECLELAERRRAFPRALRAGRAPLDLAGLRAHLGP